MRRLLPESSEKSCSTLQHTATHCNPLEHTATHCNTLQHTATHCNSLQHTAKALLHREVLLCTMCYNTLYIYVSICIFTVSQYVAVTYVYKYVYRHCVAVRCSALQCVAVCCALRCVAVRCSALQCIVGLKTTSCKSIYM